MEGTKGKAFLGLEFLPRTRHDKMIRQYRQAFSRQKIRLGSQTLWPAILESNGVVAFYLPVHRLRDSIHQIRRGWMLWASASLAEAAEQGGIPGLGAPTDFSWLRLTAWTAGDGRRYPVAPSGPA